MKFPFDEPLNTMVFSCCHIIDKGFPILYVSHDEDGMWQFLCGSSHDISEARLVSLYSIFTLDHSLAQLATMPIGSIAQRESKETVWIIKNVE